MGKTKDPNRPERTRKIFVRKTDIIHTNHSLWSALITFNGIIIAINTIGTKPKYYSAWVIWLCVISIFMLIICFYCSRYKLETKIATLDAKTKAYEKGQKPKKEKNEKWYYKAYVWIIVPTLWKEIASLVLTTISLIILTNNIP